MSSVTSCTERLYVDFPNLESLTPKVENKFEKNLKFVFKQCNFEKMSKGDKNSVMCKQQLVLSGLGINRQFACYTNFQSRQEEQDLLLQLKRAS